MSDRSDENTIEAARRMLAEPAKPPTRDVVVYHDPNGPMPPPTPTTPRGRWLLALVGLMATAALVLGLLAVVRDDGQAEPLPTAAPTSPVPTAAPVAAIVIENGLIGPVQGTTDDDGEQVALPGQPVSAPHPQDGEAVSWQWELCPAADSASDDCTPIGGATTQTWPSPPTPEPIQVRVVVRVDLGGAQVLAASPTYTALPEGTALVQSSATIQQATTTARTTTVRATTTTLPRNAYGDVVGAPVTDSSSPAGTFALAAAARASTSPAAGSNQMAVLLRWVQLRTVGANAPGRVSAAADGYQVTIGTSTFQLTNFVVDGDTVSDVTICLLDGSCPKASDAVYINPVCPAGTAGCPTLTSQSSDTIAIARGSVTGVGPGPELLYETISERPIASVSQDDALVTFADGWYLVQLPSQPPAGARQELTVVYSDADTPDRLTIVY